MSRVIADGLSKRATATTQEAEAGTVDKYPDAAGVHAAFNQYGLGLDGAEVFGNTSDDFNTLTTSGFYTVYHNPEATRPPVGVDDVGSLHVGRGNNGYLSQMGIYSRYLKDVTYMRSRHFDGTWTSWKQVYHQGSILGTVSQSAGVPTGAIIERGSNANGEYTKFADGTLICSTANTGNTPLDTALGSYYYASLTLDFAAIFAASPVCSVDVVDATSGAFAQKGSSSAEASGTDYTFLIASPYSGVSARARVTAIGRWY